MAGDKYVRTHWIQRTYRSHWHQDIDFWQANEYAMATARWSKFYGESSDWMTGLFTHESYWGRHATDKKDSWGVPQLQVKTAQLWLNSHGGRGVRVTPEFLKEHPEISIRIACGYFHDLLRHYHHDLERATRAYNAGTGNVDRGCFLDQRKDPAGAPVVPGAAYYLDVLSQYQKFEKYKESRSSATSYGG